MVSFEDMPLELLHEILTLASTGSESGADALCRVSKRFNLVATPILYHNIRLDSLKKTVLCFTVLTRNPSRALAVRGITFNFRCSGTPLSSFVKLMDEGFKAVSEITELTVFIQKECSANSVPLDNCSFPRLRKLCYHVVHNPNILPFLARHPTIEELRMSPCRTLDRIDLSCVSLPELQVLHAPYCMLPYIQSGPKLSGVALHSDLMANPMEMTRHISFLARPYMCITELNCTVLVCNSELIIDIGQHFPYLTRLVIAWEFFRRLEALAATESILPNMKQLRDFEFDSTRGMGASGEPTEGDIDEQFKTVLSWNELCPTLNHCTIGYGLRWSRQDSTWVPLGYPICSNWIMHKLVSGEYPELLQLMEEEYT